MKAKRLQTKQLFKRSRPTPQELEHHRKSMAFCDEIRRMSDSRIQLAQILQDEHQRISALLQLSYGDLRAILPLLIAQIEHIAEDTHRIVLKAIKVGDDEVAAIGARSLATWSREQRKLVA